MNGVTIYAVVGFLLLAGTAGISAKLYYDGVQAERAAALTKGVELVKERDQLNVQVRTATDADICARLGGKWLPDTNECS